MKSDPVEASFRPKIYVLQVNLLCISTLLGVLKKARARRQRGVWLPTDRTGRRSEGCTLVRALRVSSPISFFPGADPRGSVARRFVLFSGRFWPEMAPKTTEESEFFDEVPGLDLVEQRIQKVVLFVSGFGAFFDENDVPMDFEQQISPFQPPKVHAGRRQLVTGERSLRRERGAVCMLVHEVASAPVQGARIGATSSQWPLR